MVQLPQFKDQSPTASLNSANGSSGAASAPIAPVGYLVNKNGEIEIPLIGKVKVADLTTFDAADAIRVKSLEYLKSPNVQVRILNFKITVLGEVNKPGSYTVPNEKVSVVDAIGIAGDLTIFGKRDNILLIRDVDGKKEFARLNINSSDIFKSPYLYLKQNDVLYIEANKAKIATNNTRSLQVATIGVSLLSLVVILLTRL